MSAASFEYFSGPKRHFSEFRISMAAEMYIGKKERKSLWPNAHIKYIQRFVGLSEYDYIRQILNKNHSGKVPSTAAER